MTGSFPLVLLVPDDRLLEILSEYAPISRGARNGHDLYKLKKGVSCLQTGLHWRLGLWLCGPGRPEGSVGAVLG